MTSPTFSDPAARGAQRVVGVAARRAARAGLRQARVSRADVGDQQPLAQIRLNRPGVRRGPRERRRAAPVGQDDHVTGPAERPVAHRHRLGACAGDGAREQPGRIRLRPVAPRARRPDRVLGRLRVVAELHAVRPVELELPVVRPVLGRVVPRVHVHLAQRDRHPAADKGRRDDQIVLAERQLPRVGVHAALRGALARPVEVHRVITGVEDALQRALDILRRRHQRPVRRPVDVDARLEIDGALHLGPVAVAGAVDHAAPPGIGA